jgi:hypothetical protein
MTKVKRNRAGGAFQPFNKEKSVGKKTIVLGRLGKGVRIEGFFFFLLVIERKRISQGLGTLKGGIGY